MRYTVTKAFRPGGSGSPEAPVGSDLDLSDSQARVFKALKWIKDSEPAPSAPAAPEPVPEPVRRTYYRRDMTAETSSDEPEKAAAAKKTTRSYTRRTASE